MAKMGEAFQAWAEQQMPDEPKTLAELRDILGTAEIASRLKVSQRTVQRWIAGETGSATELRKPDPFHLAALNELKEQAPRIALANRLREGFTVERVQFNTFVLSNDVRKDRTVDDVNVEAGAEELYELAKMVEGNDWRDAGETFMDVWAMAYEMSAPPDVEASDIGELGIRLSGE